MIFSKWKKFSKNFDLVWKSFEEDLNKLTEEQMKFVYDNGRDYVGDLYQYKLHGGEIINKINNDMN